MQNIKTKIVSVFLTATISVCLICNTVVADINPGVVEFLTRCYNVALNRDPDKESLDAWSVKLSSGDECGSSVAYGFVYSPEFQNAGYSNEEYVEKLYVMLLGRESDPDGKAMWVSKLDSGDSSARDELFYGFANSQEFYNLCSSYGIFAGYYNPAISITTNAQINGFVDRFYSICLKRHGDMAGQNSWAMSLANGSLTGTDLAYGFVFSNEFINSDTSNEYFVEVLYRTFMGREPDSLGVVWTHYLDRGTMTREEVFDSFAGSTEFKAICSDYGIVAGDPCASINTDPDQQLLTNIYSTDLLLMFYYDSYANADMDIVYEKIPGTDEDNLLFANQKFYNNYKTVQFIGDLENQGTYTHDAKEFWVRVYCDESSDDVIRYGLTSIMFALDYEGLAEKKTDGTNYYYDLTYTMPFDLFSYTQDITVNDRALIFIVSDVETEHLYMAGLIDIVD